MAVELLKGNVALAEAAIRAGVQAYFGYPITPQTELLEHMAQRMPELGRAFVQAESEVAAINMVYGAACTGCPGHDLVVQPRHQPDAGRVFVHRRVRGAVLRGGCHARRAGPGQHPAFAVGLLQVTRSPGMAITIPSCSRPRPCKKRST